MIIEPCVLLALLVLSVFGSMAFFIFVIVPLAEKITALIRRLENENH